MLYLYFHLLLIANISFLSLLFTNVYHFICLFVFQIYIQTLSFWQGITNIKEWQFRGFTWVCHVKFNTYVGEQLIINLDKCYPILDSEFFPTDLCTRQVHYSILVIRSVVSLHNVSMNRVFCCIGPGESGLGSHTNTRKWNSPMAWVAGTGHLVLQRCVF